MSPRKRNAKTNGEQAAAIVEYANAINVRGCLRAGVELVGARKSATRKPTSGAGSLRVQLMTKKKKVRGKGAYQSLGTRHRIAIAYDQDTRHRTLSRKFEVHPKTVARTQVLVASTYMAAQLAWLERLTEVCESGTHAPACVCVSRKWDETQEIVGLPLIGGAAVAQDTFDIMVGSVRVVVAWPPAKQMPTLCFDLAQPPVALLTNRAENIFSATYRHPALAHLHLLLKRLLVTAQWRSHINEADGALGNDRFHHHAVADDRVNVPQCFYEFHHCSNHAHHLLVVSAVSSLKLNMAAEVYTANIFLSQSGHFVRLQRTVRETTARHLKVMYTQPPAGSQQYVLEFRDFMVRNEKFSYQKDGEISSHGKRVVEAFDKFALVCNGSWWNAGRQPRPRVLLCQPFAPWASE